MQNMHLGIRGVFSHFVAALILFSPSAICAQEDVLAPGWILNSHFSGLYFKTTIHDGVQEQGDFMELIGGIAPSGEAVVTIKLDSIDTRLVPRNERVRTLFFETLDYPDLVISAQISTEILEGITDSNLREIQLSVNISMRGISHDMIVATGITLLDENMISVYTIAPTRLNFEDLDLLAGLQKLESSAQVSIVPAVDINFDLTFYRAASVKEFEQLSTIQIETDIELIAEIAPEAIGPDCMAQIDILAKDAEITFNFGRATIAESSYFVLDNMVGVFENCPDLNVQIAGHTDSDGSSEKNQILSLVRASTVQEYFVEAGVDPTKLRSVGYGESQPIVENTTRENKRLNRRIEIEAVVF